MTDRAKGMRGSLRLTRDERDFLSRRTLPFLDSVGLNRPISFVLEEVYLQGLRDAVEATLKSEKKA